MPNLRRYERSVGLIAALTLASRILGLVRESVFGYFFSTSGALSAFRVALMIPNLARRLFGEGALSSAMIPVLTKSLAEAGEPASQRLVGSILRALVIVLAAGVLVAEVIIVALRAFHDDLALQLTAVVMPYMVLICTVAVIGGVLNVRHHFAVPAGVPMILNVCLIAGTWGTAHWLDLDDARLMFAACVSVLVAGVLQLMFSANALRRIKFLPSFAGPWFDPHLKSVTTLMAPMVLGLATVQINTMFDYLIAYAFVVRDGERVGPAVLGFAQVLYQLPLGVFGIAIATAIFPVLSISAAKEDRAGLSDVFSRGVRLSLFIAIPSAVGLILVARPLVGTFFEHGEFSAEDTHRVAGVLVFYCLGMPAYFVQHIVVRTYYAIHDSKTPARSAVVMVCVNFAMNLSLVFVLEERGLALATAACALIQSAWLARRLQRAVPEINWRALGFAVLRMFAAAGLMAGVVVTLNSLAAIENFAATHRSMMLTILVLSGIMTYAAAARALRLDELSVLLHRRRTDSS